MPIRVIGIQFDKDAIDSLIDTQLGILCFPSH